MLTLDAVLHRTGLLFGDRTAFIEDHRNQTWREHIGRVGRIAGYLERLGIGRGDKFAVIGKNSVRQAEIVHAAYWSGAVPVPINLRLAAAEIEFILDDAEISVVFAENEFANLADTRELIVFEGNADDIKAYQRRVDASDPLSRAECEVDDVAILLYTGGTTGRAKGVPLTHRNIVSNGLQLIPVMKPSINDVYLHLAPMFHSADLVGTPFTMMGAAHCYLDRFSGENARYAIERHGVTATMMTPTMALSFLDVSKNHEAPAHFRHLLYGSSPITVDRIRDIAKAFPTLDLQQGYGLTETSPILTTLDPVDHRNALSNSNYEILRSAGRPLIGVEICIAATDGKTSSFEDAGEILVRGPNVLSGYHRRPDENELAFRDGWFCTGDIGRFDCNGYLFILDRKKDMIVTGGENVYSGEVEAILAGHPDICEAAIVGVPDSRYGESLLAVDRLDARRILHRGYIAVVLSRQDRGL